MELAELTTRGFSELLASDAPAPGGGSTAALEGALGAALIAMVCRLTADKPGYREHRETVLAVQEQAEALRVRFLDAMERDTEAFRRVSDAFALPKATEEEKAALEKKAEESKPVLDFLKETLGDQIKEARVSRLLKSGAVCLTADGPITLEMETYLQRVDPENAKTMKAQRVLELNPDSPAFAALQQAVETDQEKAATYAKLLYAQAQLIAGIPLEDPAGYSELVCSLMK